MNKTELQQKIVDMEKQIAGLKKELEKKDKGIWKPEINEEYFYITEGLNVLSYDYDDDDTDDRFMNSGNYFKTEKEAERMANYLKYTNLLRKYVEEHSEPLDWENRYNDKYFGFYDYQTKSINIECCSCVREFCTIYASSEEVLREAIEFVGEENLKKYVFQVEE